MKNNKQFFIPGIFLFMFFLFTLATMKVNVQPIGPEESEVGLATINQFMFEKIGVNLMWYSITDWLGLGAIFVAFLFGLLGFFQLIKRKSLFKVDLDIILLGLCYLFVILLYIIFELFIVNYRPIIINDVLEASYPSSHIMIVIFIMATSMIQFNKRIKNSFAKSVAQVLSILVIITTIVGRFISGVHWFTDIIGGIMLATTLVLFYIFQFKGVKEKNNRS